MDETDIFLDKLSRLPRISFDELTKHWDAYKTSLGTLSEGSVVNVEYHKKNLHGQWMSISSWYDKLIADFDRDIKKSRISKWVWRPA
jgi:hypothetical protein